MEDSFGEVDMGETDIIHGTVDDVIYNLWGVKEPNYVMRMMATDGVQPMTSPFSTRNLILVN